jgi:hypothetical protein
MSASDMRQLLLMLGLPGEGMSAAARALRDAAAGVPAPAGTLPPLNQFANRLASGLGLSAENPGPLALAGRTIGASATVIDEDLEASHLDRAATLLRAAVPPGRVTVLVVPAMLLLPRFWLRALAHAEIRTQVVLVDRNPLALAAGEPAVAARTVRRTIFAWHYLTVQLLAAAPDALVLPVRALVDGAPIDRQLGPAAGARWSAPDIRSHPRDDADLAMAPIASGQAGELAALLTGWNTLTPDARHEITRSLAARLDDAMAVTGIAQPPARRIALTGRPRAAPPARTASAPLRPLLVHYHIFKNAGTSVDRMLKASFGDAWLEQEFTGPLRQRQEQLRTLLAERPDLTAFSSHTAMLPEPEVPGRLIVPVIFMRHPLLRLRSAYSFERKQVAETRGAILAKSTDLRGYIEALLADPAVRQARNFQAFRFAAGTPGRPAEERARALDTIARLPFVGLVEAYDESIGRLGRLVQPLLPDFKPVALHENATAEKDDIPLASRLSRLREEVGDSLYQRLEEENGWDLELFDTIRQRYASAL